MIYYDHQFGNTRVAVWHVTEDYDELLGLLPDADSVSNEAALRFTSEKRQIEWTAVRVLLYTMLGRQVHIDYNEQGAPLLPRYEGLNISISHTRGYVAVAVSNTDKVGVDVEQIEKVDEGQTTRVERIKSKFIADDEYADSVIGMLLHWSAKESVYKVLGKEDVNFKEDLHVEPFDELCYEGQFSMIDMNGDTHIIIYKVFDEFVLTLTSKVSQD